MKKLLGGTVVALTLTGVLISQISYPTGGGGGGGGGGGSSVGPSGTMQVAGDTPGSFAAGGIGSSSTLQSVFLGLSSGNASITGNLNAGAGYFACAQLSTGSRNVCYGWAAGSSMTTPNDNAFGGYKAGTANIVGTLNTVWGANAGINLTSSGNAIFGGAAGNTIVGGGNNTILGNGADVGAATSFSRTVIGSGAVGLADHTVTLGTSSESVIIPSGIMQLVVIIHVAALGTCNSGAEGTSKRVDDALAPTWNTTVVGGGTVHIGVSCNGTNWVAGN